MNGLLRKEVRAIAPVWLLTMVLAVVPVWLLWPGPQGALIGELGWLVFAPFGLGVLLLSLASFGQELNWGTFSVILAQPISRQRLWRIKVAVLAVALGVAFLALFVSNQLRVETALESLKQTVWRNAFDRPGEQSRYFVKLIADTRRAASHDTMLIGGLEVLVGFAGGLWTTLLCRQVTAAFWLTFLVPMGLSLLAGSLFKSFSDTITRSAMALLLGSYSAAGFLWARRFFLRVQDTQWTGGVVALPAWLGTASAGARGARRFRPVAALLRRELQAQQVNFLLAGGLLLLHLAVIGFRRWSAAYLAAHQFTAMTLEMAPVLWLALPLLVGGVAVAEERKLGMFQSASCLPASRDMQLFLKLLVGLVMGCALGGVLPLAIESLAAPLRTGFRPAGVPWLGEVPSQFSMQLMGAAGLTLLGFYSSTLTRNALQSLAMALVAALAVFIAIVAALHAEFGEVILWRGRLIAVIGLPSVVVLLLALARRNFRQLQPDAWTWSRNGFAWLFGLLAVAALTTTVYHRAWEAWLPDEPMHSWNFRWLSVADGVQGRPIRIAGGMRAFEALRPKAKLEAAGLQRAALLPDGRLWLEQRPVRVANRSMSKMGSVFQYTTGARRTGFAPGSTWRDVAVDPFACFGIQSDGTLWDLSNTEGGLPPEQVGTDRDWEAISGGWDQFWALKSNGTLWQWSWRTASAGKPFNDLTRPVPIQSGSDDDWVAVCSSGYFSAGFKTDGSVWRWDRSPKVHRPPQRWLSASCSRPVSVSVDYSAIAAVCSDGTLWIGGELTNSVYARGLEPALVRQASHELVRWGRDSDWKEIRFVGWGKAVGLKVDGSLYEWNFLRELSPTARSVQPTAPSRYADWLAIGADNNAFLALARDGSLCLWGDPEGGRFNDWNGLPDPQRWLMPSRIKARRLADLAR